jgi:hypothetical protein
MTFARFSIVIPRHRAALCADLLADDDKKVQI